MAIKRINSAQGYEAALENQKLFTPAQRDMAMFHPHLAYFIVRRRKLSKAKRWQLFERDKGQCVHCGCDLDFNAFHIDHLFPVVAGGSDEDDNLAAACPPCNLRKGASCG